ncbi:HD-GYP domain-containing protein [Ureibacillus sp. FSL K6-0786]|uniref:HD-GYP domain-containing protein n=1 Tax=Ureibacillus sp. FSL K6-0786 TaxID=2954607 RepID=UPI0030DBB420
MRLISINAAKPGMIMGRAIFNESGHPLVQRHVKMTEGIIRRLKQMNIQYIYIEDEISKDIVVEETVPLELRAKAVSNIERSFRQMKGLNSRDAAFVLDKQSKKLNFLVDDLLKTIFSNNEMLTIITDTYLYDEALFQHSFNVTLYSLAIAKELGYPYEDLRTIGIGALLHDVGKMVLPLEILHKPGQLTDEEFAIMKLHTRYGFNILRNLHTVSLLVAHCALQHHERLDGSGYPRGLVDNEIHPYAKIIAVADVFDAVTSNRVYRDKMLPSEGIDLIESDSGTLFEKRVVDALIKSVVHYPNGTVLCLSDGRRGIVAKQNTKQSSRPYVRIFEENGMLLESTYLLNLEEFPQVEILRVDTEYLQP